MSGATALAAAAQFVVAAFPLPRCDHGQALADHSGAQTAPSCGCRLVVHGGGETTWSNGGQITTVGEDGYRQDRPDYQSSGGAL